MNRHAYEFEIQPISSHVASSPSRDGWLFHWFIKRGILTSPKGPDEVLLVTDINRPPASSSISDILVILCDLDRYSADDVVKFIKTCEAREMRLATISQRNQEVLVRLATQNSADSELVAPTVPPPLTPSVTLAVIRVDFYSRYIALDSSLLMPVVAKQENWPELEGSDKWVSDQNHHHRSLITRLRYPLAVTKRHLLNCLADLRDYTRPNPRSSLKLVRGDTKASIIPVREHQLKLQGTVFLAILEKFDYASDWPQLVSAFCLGLKDHEDGTLIIWIVAAPKDSSKADLHHLLCSLAPFKCAVALIEGELAVKDVESLFNTAHYLVNTDIFSSTRLDVLLAAQFGTPAISPPNSMFTTLNEELIWCQIPVDDVLGSPDRSDSYQLVRRHQRVCWQQLSEQLAAAYALKRRRPEYDHVRQLTMRKYQHLVGQTLN